ncbi:MAG TPA: hypothetical protein VN682_12370 [Terriglobales bacterium]|nr:hypothetical protein [Terriglobales bacterium]
MRRLRTMLGIALLLSSICALAQAPASHFDPSPLHNNGQRKSFVDFVLGRFNPGDIDYGQRIEQRRQQALDSTVRDFGFWANMLVMLMLCLAFFMAYWQYRQNQNLRFHTARLLAAYRNQLVQVCAHNRELASKYEQLRRAADEPPQGAVLAKTASATRGTSATESGSARVQLLENAGTHPPTEQQLLQENERLKRQLSQENQTSSSLRRQVTTLGKRLEEEQHKSRNLRAG